MATLFLIVAALMVVAAVVLASNAKRPTMVRVPVRARRTRHPRR